MHGRIEIIDPITSGRYRGICECGSHSWAVLTKAYVVLVSPEDDYILREYVWSASVAPKTVYATRGTRGKVRREIKMHRQIMQAPALRDVDHRNHIGLDNQRDNLRVCTRSQNKMNTSRAPKGYSRHTDGKKWEARIKVSQKVIYLGLHDTEAAAAKAYADAREKYFPGFERHA